MGFSLKVKKQVSFLIHEGFSIVHKFLTAHWYLHGSVKKKNKSRNQYVLLMKDFDERMYLLPVLGKEIYRVIVQT